MKVGTFTQQGQRAYQEDYLYANPETGLFMVCDGVGGAAKGDEASKLVVKTIREMVEEKGIRPTGKALVHQLTTAAQTALKDRVIANPGEEGMGTTLTMAYFHEQEVTLAHIGDSRIYYIKGGQKKYWQSKDHSLVQELYDSGILKSEADMETHPMRNRITRALQGQPEPKAVKADVLTIEHLEAGDVIMLCSDGVLEPYTGTGVVSILADQNLSPEEKLEQIKSDCQKQSNDNNTCILITLESQDTKPGTPDDTMPWRDTASGTLLATPAIVDTMDKTKELPSQPPKEKPKGGSTTFMLFLIALLIISMGVCYYFFFDQKPNTPTPTPQPPPTEQSIPEE